MKTSRAAGGVIPVAFAVGPEITCAGATSKSDIVRSQDTGHAWKAVLEQGLPVSIRP